MSDTSNSEFKRVVNSLSSANDIRVEVVSVEEMRELYKNYGYPSVAGTFIIAGGIKFVDTTLNPADYELILHELIHILSVPKMLRPLMHVDTEKSYKKIKSMIIDNDRVCTESAVLGAQYLIFEKCNYFGYLGGSFFSGHIRNYTYRNGKEEIFTDIPVEWIMRGQKLLNNINLSI